ncbi:G/T mismatch-specific thymine DNA glycosylase [Trichinella spiralis]|uniref:G/T mismatch-specific thymine DNA glycosylase n=1 Tax=Trichinella spiralis TaxID=6334 RepID=A0ABR3KST3_TRISP
MDVFAVGFCLVNQVCRDIRKRASHEFYCFSHARRFLRAFQVNNCKLQHNGAAVLTSAGNFFSTSATSLLRLGRFVIVRQVNFGRASVFQSFLTTALLCCLTVSDKAQISRRGIARYVSNWTSASFLVDSFLAFECLISTALAAIGTQHCPSVLPDHIAHGLDILIVGINPGLISATHQHYYANHSNHFWKCLFLSRLIPKRLQASDDHLLPEYGIGVTNIVSRVTRSSSCLTTKEIREGAAVLRRKVLHYHPKIVAFNGKGIYSVFCGKSTVEYGLQKQRIDGSDALVYVMPSSSARCSQFPRLIDKVPFFVELKKLRDQLCCHNTSGGGIGSARHRLLFMESQSQISFDGLPEKANGGDFYVGMSDVEGNVDDNEQQDVAASTSAVEQQLQQHAAEVWSDHHVGDIGSNLSLDLSACIESGMPPIMQVERKLVGEVATSDSESTSSLVRSFAAEQVPLAAATDQQQQQQQQQQQHAVREFFGESTSQSGSQVAERSSESPGQVAMSQVESLAETSSPKVPTPNSSSSLPQQIAVHVEEAIEAVVQRARDGPLEMPAFRTPPEKHHPPANAHQHNMLANLAMQQGINFGLDELGLSAKPDQLFACYNDQVPFGAYYQQAAVAAAGGRGSYQHHPSPNDTGASFLNSNQACYGSVLPQWTFGAVPATSSSNPDLYSQQAAQACRLMQGQSTYFQNAASGSFSSPTGSIIGQQMYNTALPTVSAELSSAYFNQQTQQLQSSLYSGYLSPSDFHQQQQQQHQQPSQNSPLNQ